MDVSKEEQSVKNMSKLTTALPQTDGMRVYTNSEPPVGVPWGRDGSFKLGKKLKFDTG